MKKITLLLSVVFVMVFGLSASAQFSCDTAVSITDGFTATGITTPGTGGVEDWNDPNPAGCASNAFYWDDDVYLYQYTAGANDEEISMTIFTRNGWNGIGVFSDCTGTALSGCLVSANSIGGGVSQNVLATVGAGETVFIAIGQWGAPNDLDFDVTAFAAIALVNPPSCSVVTSPVDDAIDVLEIAPITWTQAAGGATGYYITIGTTSGGTDVLNNFDVGNVLTYTPSPVLEYSTEYFVTITAYNSNGNASGCIESSFTLRDAPPEGSTCGNPIMVTTPLPYSTNDDTSNYGDDYSGTAGTDCGSGSGYLNGDDVVYAYSPTADTSIDIGLSNLTDNYAGVFVYSDCANIGTQCETGDVNGFSTDDILIDNFSVLGGQTYYIVISTWAAPQTVGYTLTISENTCVDSIATYAVVGDCANGQQFFIDVDVTDLGSAGTVTVADDQASMPQTISAASLVTFGPFTNGTPVVITVANDDDANCTLTSTGLTQEFCQEFTVDCAVGPENLMYCYEDDGDITPVIFTFTSSDGTPLNLNINSGDVEWNAFGGEPYDPLIVLDTDGVTELYNGGGNVGDLSGLSFQSTGNTISFYIESDFVVNCNSSATINPLDVTVSCATCVNQVATYQVIDDCANGNQFLVDVNITDLGDATTLTISNNIDATTVSANAVGIYQVGPFPFGVDVVITTSNDQDGNCVINSPAIQLLACPPANDNPCDATIAQVNTDDSCSLITPGTLLEATDSGVPNGSCTGNADDDVWYEFTALNDIQIISLLNINGGGFQGIDHAVYEGTCNALVELYCSDADASVTPVLTVGNTYYVRIFSNGNDSEDYTFDLCIRPGSGNVLVDQTTYTVEELVIDVLIDSPCAQISNITFSTGTNFGEENGIGYFSNPDGGFPFEQGLLLTTGNASEAAGPNTNFVSSGTGAWPGDPFLAGITGEASNNATIIEFDFVTQNDELSFDFIMASEEYDGNFECEYSDAFAFLLTDVLTGVTTNLAIVPGTTDPIFVTNIHPDNGNCAAVNEQYFGEYIPDNLPPISFDGRTGVFTASSPVTIGGSYHIKLVIADSRDSGWDSGVFLKAGSFDIGEIDLGGDITIADGTAVCEDEPVILDTSAPNIAHVWYKDNFVIPGETSSTLTVTEEGTYFVQIIFSPSCIIDDEVLIEFLPNPVLANTPNDIPECSTTNQAAFTLTDNDTVVLGAQNPADFTITYHESQTNADSSTNSLVSPYTNTSNPQTIYVRIEDNATGCFETTSFSLIITSPTHTAESVNMTGCDNDDDGIASFNLFDNDTYVLNGQDASQFNVTYYTSQAGADTAIGALASPYDSPGETIFVRVETVGFTNCYVTNSFNLEIGTEPQTTFVNSVDNEVCPNATVPITITATPVNYTESEVTINWYLDNGLISGENGLTLSVLDAGDYEIEVIFNDTGCSNIEAPFTVVELETCVIPQGISPNGDEYNQNFDLSSYGVTKLEIFNRNGTLVYSKKNYTNEWHGQTDGGEDLPVGTYFYTMEYQNGKRKSAWIYIQREN